MPYGGIRSDGGGQGARGVPGITPQIGSNGNWFIGTKDTGVHASGGAPFTLTSAGVAAAVNNGVPPDAGTLAGLGPGWSYIPATHTTISGRPPQSTGDLILFKQIVSDKLGAKRGVMFAYGQNKSLTETMWIRYKVSSSWLPWLEFSAAGHGGVLPAGLGTRLTSLETWRTAETKTATALHSALGTLEQRLQGVQTQVAALNLLTEPEVEKALIQKGWGPLPKVPTQPVQPGQGGGGKGGGGDHHVLTLPRISANFGNVMPTTLKGYTTSTTGVVSIHRIATSRQRIFVAVINDNNEASKVTGISVDGGMPGQWQPRDVTLNGHKWRVFYSAGGYSEASAKVTVHFN